MTVSGAGSGSEFAVVVPPSRGSRFQLKPGARWPISLLVAALIYFIYSYFDQYFQGNLPAGLHNFTHQWLPIRDINTALVYVMAALGLNIVVGYAGLLDLGFVAFWAIGGYSLGWVTSDIFAGLNFHFFTSDFANVHKIVGIHISFWLALILAGLICALFGVIIGAPTLRLRSDYLALVTLGFGEIIPEVFHNGDNVFGLNISNGTKGIQPVDYPRFFGFDNTGKFTWKDITAFDPLSKFVIFLVLIAVIIFASLRIRDGKLGRAWLAIREDELAASAMGVPLMRTKLSAYGIGAVAGGIAGAAYAVQVGGVLPDSFKFSISITLLGMVVLGGMGNVWGVLVGALLLSWINTTLLPPVENSVNDAVFTPLFNRQLSLQFFVFGALLVLMMLFRREGFLPEARTRLVLREPGRTEAEALGAELEDNAPELESLDDDSVHAGGSVAPAPHDTVDGGRS